MLLWDAGMSGFVRDGQLSRQLIGDQGIADPLRAVVVISDIIKAGQTLGYTFHLSTDFLELAKARRLLRESEPSPMFDLAVDHNLPDIAFWMKAVNAEGEISALQGYRMDIATPNLAEWTLGWMMGLYARRREMIIPRQALPPVHTLTSLIRGKVVYLGEFWVSRHGKKLCRICSRGWGFFCRLSNGIRMRSGR